MEFDPFAPESIGQPAQVAETKPSFGQTVRSNVGNIAKRAGAVLGFAGSMVAFDQANAQEVAVVTPQGKPPIAGLAVPGNSETTTEEAPTAEMIIQILKKEVETIRRKFPTCTDAALAELVGKIALGTIDSKRLETLAGAFEKGSPEWGALMNFSKVVSIPKPPAELASPRGDEKKLPPLNETKEQKAKRETVEKLLKTANKGLFERDNWRVDTSKGGEAEVKIKKGLIETRYKGDAKKIAGQAPTTQPRSSVGISIILAPGTYKIDTIISGSGQCVIKFYVPGDKDKPINNGGIAIQTGENIVTVPAGLDHQFVEIKNNALENGLRIEKFEITSVDTNGLAAK